MPLSYLHRTYTEPSGPAGSTVNVSEAGLARPALNLTGGRRRRKRSSRSCRTCKKRGGFYPGVMGSFLQNAQTLLPAVGITGLRMFKNYNKTKKNRT